MHETVARVHGGLILKATQSFNFGKWYFGARYGLPQEKIRRPEMAPAKANASKRAPTEGGPLRKKKNFLSRLKMEKKFYGSRAQRENFLGFSSSKWPFLDENRSDFRKKSDFHDQRNFLNPAIIWKNRFSKEKFFRFFGPPFEPGSAHGKRGVR